MAGYSSVLQADTYDGYRALYESARITKAACMAHAWRKIHNVRARAPTDITTEACSVSVNCMPSRHRSGGCSAEQHLAARKTRAVPLMQSLYDWIETPTKTLSRHSIRRKCSHTC
ncbi:IS66 family transposase [Escherichia coli]|uniref:IS66 family transposase n=1 Tax=Escherichia TaxID=561 RepID=UPI0008FB78E6